MWQTFTVFWRNFWILNSYNFAKKSQIGYRINSIERSKNTNLIFVCCYSTEKPQLPPGVSQQDADLYKEVREKAAKALAETKLNLAVGPNELSPSKVGLAEQERCPAAIEFGKYEIETWYSSPFPQEYAR